MTEKKPIQSCSRCLCDTTISTIRFDEKGVCQYCHSHDILATQFADAAVNQKNLELMVEKIKADGKGKDYDCVVGVSGGTDSSYVLHLCKKLGLRPLAVHFDNGWNTKQAAQNIHKLTTKLNLDLHTHVVDWEEFRDLQVSFLKAATPCIEVPTDVGIHGTLFRTAAKEGLKYILGGQSFKTEGTVPKVWSYMDGTYINTVHKIFGTKKLKSHTNVTLFDVFYYTFVKGIKQVPILNYVDYSKTAAKSELKEVYGWEDYSGHHYENIYSRFAFGWYSFHKFGIDKRKVSYSGPVRTGQITRTEGLEKLKELPDVPQDIVDYVVNKLRLSQAEFDAILKSPNKTYKDYFTSENILKHMKTPAKLSIKWGYFTPVLYEKYFDGL